MNRTMAAQSPDCADGAWSGSLQGRARREAVLLSLISRARWKICCSYFFDQSKTISHDDASYMLYLCICGITNQHSFSFWSFIEWQVLHSVLPHLLSSPSLGDCIYPPRYLAVAQSAFVWVQSPSSVNTLICSPVTRCHFVTWSHCTQQQNGKNVNEASPSSLNPLWNAKMQIQREEVHAEF